MNWSYSNILCFDESVRFDSSFDFFGWEKLRQEVIGRNGQRYAVWKDIKSGKKWSAYGGEDGCLALWAFETEEEAKAAVERWSTGERGE